MTDAPDPCYAAAMRILSFRFNSETELRRKLRGKKFEPADIDATIERLQSEKWLDDERFAGAFVRTRSSKKIGRQRILRELQAAGVDGDSARQAVDTNIEPEREREQLIEVYQKKLRIVARRHGDEYASTDEGRNKLFVWLLKHGYDAALISSVMKEIGVAHHQRNS